MRHRELRLFHCNVGIRCHRVSEGADSSLCDKFQLSETVRVEPNRNGRLTAAPLGVGVPCPRVVYGVLQMRFWSHQQALADGRLIAAKRVARQM